MTRLKREEKDTAKQQKVHPTWRVILSSYISMKKIYPKHVGAFTPLIKNICFFSYDYELHICADDEERLVIFMLHSSQLTHILLANASGSDAFEGLLSLSTFTVWHGLAEFCTVLK